MADPVTAAIALTTVAAGAGLASGFSSAAAMKSQAKEAEYNARNLETQGKQLSAARREELNQSFAAIDAIRAGRNVSSGSPTDMAIRSSFRRRSRAAEDAEQFGQRLGIVTQRTRAQGLKDAAPMAVIAGIGDAAKTGMSLVS